MKKFSFQILLVLLSFSLASIGTGCQSSATCGNEVQVVKQPRVRGGGTTSCGNQKVVARKKKLHKKDMGLFGKEGNPYNPRGARR